MKWGVIEVWHYSNYKVMIESTNEALSAYDCPCPLKSAYEKVCMELIFKVSVDTNFLYM
jgi:hypothetical protein